MTTHVEPFDDGDEALRAAGWERPKAFNPLPPDVVATPMTSGKVRNAVGWYWLAALGFSLAIWTAVYWIIVFVNAMFPFPVFHK